MHEIVVKHMVHGTRGSLNPKSPCMVDRHCSKNYLKQFLKETKTDENSCPHYRRRSEKDGGISIELIK